MRHYSDGTAHTESSKDGGEVRSMWTRQRVFDAVSKEPICTVRPMTSPLFILSAQTGV